MEVSMKDIMNSADIAFPNIGLYLENVPKSFSVFGFQIALYGVMIGLGVLSGVCPDFFDYRREDILCHFRVGYV